MEGLEAFFHLLPRPTIILTVISLSLNFEIERKKNVTTTVMSGLFGSIGRGK